MDARHWIATAAAGILLVASASPAVAQRASLQATATVVAPVEPPIVTVVATGEAAGALPSLVVDVEQDWGVTVQVGDEPAVVYAEPRALRHDALGSVPVRVTVAAN